MSEHYVLTPCCEAAIDVSASAYDEVVCPSCSRSYPVREDIDFAEFSTESTEFYRWTDDGTWLVRFYFHNMTLDAIEGISERIKAISVRERRPLILLPILKALHDCLKRRIQQFLVFDRVPNLSSDQKAKIEADLPKPGNNLQKLFDQLLTAFPNQVQPITALRESKKTKQLLWIRNKEEHLATAAWPIPSLVHTDPTLMPDTRHPDADELGVPLAVDLNNFVVDTLKFLYDLDATEVKGWHYDQLEHFRIHATV